MAGRASRKKKVSVRPTCPDYLTITNALGNGGSIPAATTFDAEWFGPTTPASWSTQDFTFTGIQTRGQKEAGATWASDSAGQAIESAFLSMERNGMFVSQANEDHQHQD